MSCRYPTNNSDIWNLDLGFSGLKGTNCRGRSTPCRPICHMPTFNHVIQAHNRPIGICHWSVSPPLQPPPMTCRDSCQCMALVGLHVADVMFGLDAKDQQCRDRKTMKTLVSPLLNPLLHLSWFFSLFGLSFNRCHLLTSSQTNTAA